MEDIFTVFETTLVWGFCGARIPSEELYNLFDIPYRKTRGTTIYDMIKGVSELNVSSPIRDDGLMNI
jgi:hypothetical protein